MKKFILSLMCLCTLGAHADEGMWTLYNLPTAIYEQMKQYGFQLPMEQLYQSDNAVKNAVINFGGTVINMGQQRNIQVINLVSIGTIEEQMLTKLKFKTDVFDGVLNGGEDEVFLDNNKLETLVTDLGFGEGAAKEPAATEPAEAVEDIEEKKPQDEAADVIPDPVGEEDSGGLPDADALIGQGISFLGGLVKTLKNPDASKRLVDSLVKEDPATGQASIQIPVSDKESVLQFVTLLGKMLN